MKDSVKYDVIYNYLNNFVDSCFVRVYSDGNVSVSAYINNKQINLDGDFDLVYTCIVKLYKEQTK